MGYMVGHWSHYSECFSAFPHGRVETLSLALVACGVAREDIPMVEASGDVGPGRVATSAASAELGNLLDVVRDEAACNTRQGDAARAWAAAASQPHHGRRALLVAEALRCETPRPWSATAALAIAVLAVTAAPRGA
jgi:hypothetical protein